MLALDPPAGVTVSNYDGLFTQPLAGANRRWPLQFRYRGSRRESAVAQLSTLGFSHYVTETFNLVPNYKCNFVVTVFRTMPDVFLCSYLRIGTWWSGWVCSLWVSKFWPRVH